MRSYHSCLGAPFLGPDCRLNSGTRTVWAEPTYDTPRGRLPQGARWAWPRAEARDGARVDLRWSDHGETEAERRVGDRVPASDIVQVSEQIGPLRRDAAQVDARAVAGLRAGPRLAVAGTARLARLPLVRRAPYTPWPSSLPATCPAWA